MPSRRSAANQPASDHPDGDGSSRGEPAASGHCRAAQDGQAGSPARPRRPGSGRTALNVPAPPDCLPRRWTEAQLGLQRFVNDGWGDQASLLGWTVDELYRVPPVWARGRPHRRRLAHRRSPRGRSHRGSIAIETPPARSSSSAGSDASTWRERNSKETAPRRADDLPMNDKCYQ